MEVQSVQSELVTELREGCQGESLNEDHVLLALVPKGSEVSQIDETLETVKALGRVRVQGRMYNRKLDRITTLCECIEKIDPTKVPSEVKHPTTDISWPIVIASRHLASDGDSPNPLKVLFDVSASNSSGESIIQAVGDLLSNMRKSSGEGSSFRRRRMFSGILPTPAGEEALEHWLEQARWMVEERD